MASPDAITNVSLPNKCAAHAAAQRGPTQGPAHSAAANAATTKVPQTLQIKNVDTTPPRQEGKPSHG